MKERKVLFIPSNANHVRLFLPIYKILKEKYAVLIMTQGTFKNEGAEDTLLELNIDFKRLADYDKKEPEFILEKEQVGIVIVGNDIDIIPQWFINSATKMGIPSVYLQDGLLFDYETPSRSIMDSFFKKGGTSMKLKNLASKLLISKKINRLTTHGTVYTTMIHVWGKTSESYLTGKGVDKKRILITGIIGGLKIKENSSQLTEESKSIVYVPSDLVFSRILNQKEMEKLIHSACSSLSSLGCKVEVKPHPREDVKFYQTLGKKYQNLEVSFGSIYDLLPKASLVITDMSSFAVEALAATKPVIIFFPNIQKIVKPGSFPLDLVEKNAAYLARDGNELAEIAGNLLKEQPTSRKEPMKMVAEEYLGNLDGMEALRSANSIMEIMEKHP